MSAAVQSIPNLGGSAFKSTHRLASVVRQPILDSFGRVHAYELRFRGEADGDAIGASMNLFETAASFGLEKASKLKKLTGKLTAFVRCPMEALSEQLAQVLPPSLTVLEISRGSEVSLEVLANCRQMKALGFHFALDDVRAEPQTRSLLEMTDYIKVDFGGTKSDERRELLHELCPGSIMLMAKGVNTQGDYKKARDEGFTLFEGYYFCEPVAIRNRRPPVNQMLRLDILKALQKNTMDMHKVSQLVMRDGPIAYQLLRLVNSPVWGCDRRWSRLRWRWLR